MTDLNPAAPVAPAEDRFELTQWAALAADKSPREKIQDRLSAILEDYLYAEGIVEEGDPDELLLSGFLATPAQRAWVSAFVRLWDATEEAGK